MGCACQLVIKENDDDDDDVAGDAGRLVGRELSLITAQPIQCNAFIRCKT